MPKTSVIRIINSALFYQQIKFLFHSLALRNSFASMKYYPVITIINTNNNNTIWYRAVNLKHFLNYTIIDLTSRTIIWMFSQTRHQTIDTKLPELNAYTHKQSNVSDITFSSFTHIITNEQ